MDTADAALLAARDFTGTFVKMGSRVRVTVTVAKTQINK